MLLVRTELRPSPIHGIGVFLLEPVKIGDIVCERGPIDLGLGVDEVDALPPTARELIHEYATFCRDLGMWFLGGDNARFINHASGRDATLMAVDQDAVNIAARTLLIDTELTIDYATICDAVRADLPEYAR